MIRIVEDMRDVNIYLSLRKQVGWIKLDELWQSGMDWEDIRRMRM